ncbi:dihydrodipicolinate synthase family protein [Vibrio lentus]|nr:dihydrodipicolinate synthase family protein [Vibrio lentus]
MLFSRLLNGSWYCWLPERNAYYNKPTQEGLYQHYKAIAS